VAEGTGFRLTQQSSERTEALVAYVRQNAAAFAARCGRIVFSGGWAGAAEGFGRLPRQYPEFASIDLVAQDPGELKYSHSSAYLSALSPGTRLNVANVEGKADQRYSGWLYVVRQARTPEGSIYVTTGPPSVPFP
jgi:hypothetical protein